MRMPSLDRAMTLIHEAGHSFIPMEWEPPYIWRRNEKLRSLTKGVALTYKERRNSQQFSLFITENDVQIISDTTNLDAARMGVTTLLDRSKSPKERLGAINSIGMPLLNNQLWAGDLYSIRLFLDPYFSKALSAIHAADPHALKQALSVGLNPSFDYGAGSLLSIAGSNADPSILEVLLDWSTPSPNGSTSQTAAINHILLKLLDSELDGVELDFLLDLGADPNALVEANDISGYVTLENALILKGRIDLARILAPAASQTTLRSAFARLTVLNTKESNAFASELLTTKRVSAKAMIEGVPALFFALQAKNPTIAQAILEQGANPALFWNGTNALMWTLIQKRAGVCPECIDAVLADPRTDVNQQDSNGFVAFDYAIAAEQFSLAAKIASQPGFTYDFTPGSGPRAVSNDAVKTHARAVKILNQFALLNQIPAAKSVLAGYPFGFFDLEPIAQRAHQIGYSEMATIIRTAPSFKAREDRPNLAQ